MVDTGKAMMINSLGSGVSFSDDYERVGYCIFGPVIYGFSMWLAKQIREKDLSTVFFLARDGQIAQRAYEILRQFSDIPLPEGRYLYASRRAFYVPLLRRANTYEEILSLISDRSTWTESQFIEALGLNPANYRDAIDEDVLIFRSDLVNDARFISLYERVRSDVQTNSAVEYDTLIHYFKQEGFSFPAANGIGIVDIGWNGSMQRSLEALLAEWLDGDVWKRQLYGMYLGLTEYACGLKCHANGYWFDQRGEQAANDPVAPFKGLLELFFSNSEGSLKHFQMQTNFESSCAKGKDYYVPVLKPYEYDGTSELREQKNGLIRLRESALGFVRDAAQRQVVLSAEQSLKGMVRFGMRPTVREASFWGSLMFEDGAINPLAKPQTLAYYFLHPHDLKQDLLDSRWKIAFLKNLLRLPLPYERLYAFLLRWR